MSQKIDSSSDLFELRNFFFIGNYQGAVNEGSSLSSLQEADKLDRDIFVYRSYVAQKKYTFVITDIGSNAHPAIQAIKLLAVYLQKFDSKSEREVPLNTIRDWMKDGSATYNHPTIQLIYATMLYHEGSYEDAMRTVYQTNNLEGLAMLVQIYLKINRVDQAEKELRSMMKIDEDATLTQLAAAWVNLYAGGEKIGEALTTYNDMVDRYSPTPLLLNGIAICNMNLKKFAEAEQNLMKALEKDSSNPDTIVNLIACYEQQGKPADVIARQINQLKGVAPQHPYLLQVQKVEEEFDRVSKMFSS